MALTDIFRRKPDRERFAAEVLKAMRQSRWPALLHYDPTEFKIDLGAGKAIFLGNAFEDWRRGDRGKQARVVQNVVATAATLGAPTPPFEEIAAHLIPVIRNRSQMVCSWLAGSGPASPTYDGAYHPLCDSLAVAVAVDQPSSIMVAAAAMYQTWGRSFDETLALAMDNLGAHGRCAFERAEGGYFVSAYGDDYDASRILLPHVFSLLSLRGEPVAIVLSRSCVLVAGAEDVGALAAMGAAADQRARSEPRLMSTLPIVHRAGEWVPFQTTDPALATLEQLRVRQRPWDYAEQKALMDRRFAAEGRDVFVANASLATTVEGRAFTLASWAHDVVALLPACDLVSVQGPGRDTSVLRAWDDVADVCGALMREEPGYYPPRYGVERGPNPEMFERLAARPTPEGLPKRIQNEQTG